ncbi:MAG TPA: hypothetical protein PKN80_03845, partial [bacterium]|nr:hypothetical protein [bacterium]
MKRWAMLFGLVGLAVVLSGCMEIENRYYIYPERNGKQTVLITMDPVNMTGALVGLAGSFGGGQPGGGGLPGGENPVQQLEKMGISGLSDIRTTFSVYYDDILNLAGKSKEIPVGAKEIVWEKNKEGLYHFRMVLDMSQMKKGMGMGEGGQPGGGPGPMGMLAMMQGVKVHTVLVMPGRVVRSNGQNKGREARWSSSLQDLLNTGELVYEAYSDTAVLPEMEAEL